MKKTKSALHLLSDICDYYMIYYNDVAREYLKGASVEKTINSLILKLAEAHGRFKSYEIIELSVNFPSNIDGSPFFYFMEDLNNKIIDYI